MMAGSVKIGYSQGEFSVLMYDADGRLVDRYDVDFGKLHLTHDAAIAISDDVMAYLK